MRRVLLLSAAFLFSACATYRDDLNRGQRLFEESEYERSLAIWRFLEEDLDSLSYAEQARYSYLRGMTDYRLGGGKGGSDTLFRAHARHWLALAKAIEQEHPGGLSAEWQQQLEAALEDLNAEVYGTATALENSSSTAVETTTPPPGKEGEAGEGEGAKPPPGKCNTNDDCQPGETCQAKECVVI